MFCKLSSFKDFKLEFVERHVLHVVSKLNESKFILFSNIFVLCMFSLTDPCPQTSKYWHSLGITFAVTNVCYKSKRIFKKISVTRR